MKTVFFIALLLVACTLFAVPATAQAQCTVGTSHQITTMIVGASRNRLTLALGANCTNIQAQTQVTLTSQTGTLSATIQVVDNGLVTLSTGPTPQATPPGTSNWTISGAITGQLSLTVSEPQITVRQRRSEQHQFLTPRRDGERWSLWGRRPGQTVATQLFVRVPDVPHRFWCVRSNTPGIAVSSQPIQSLSSTALDLNITVTGSTDGYLLLFSDPSNAQCAASPGPSEYEVQIPIQLEVNEVSFPIQPQHQQISNSSDPSEQARILLSCDRGDVRIDRNRPGPLCDSVTSGPRAVGSGEAIAPSRVSTCVLRYYPQCGTASSNQALQAFGPQQFRIVVRRGTEEIYSQSTPAFAPEDFQQFALPFDESSTAEEYSITVYLHERGDVKYATQPSSSPIFSATIRPLGLFALPGAGASRQSVRLFFTVPVSPFSLRFSRHPSTITSSSVSSAFEVLSFRVGLLGGLEPWNYAARQAIFPVRFLGGAMLMLDNNNQPVVSLTAGASIRLPVIDSNSQLGTAASVGAFFELVGPSQGLTDWYPRFLVTTSLDLGSFLSPTTQRSAN